MQFGALNHPGLRERLIGISGKTYYSQDSCDFKILKTAKEAKRKHEYIVATSSYDIMDEIERDAFAELADTALYVIFDYDCYAYNLLAKGHIDAVVDRQLKPHDFVGLVPILKGAGCVVSDWEGYDSCYSQRTIAARTAEIKNDIVGLFSAKLNLAE